jgi:cytochrome c-type biogenesis protein CcmF
MAEIGYIALVLALVASIYSIAAYIFGIRGNQRLASSARNGVIAAAILFSLSVLILLIALVSHQFQIEYVAHYTSTHMTLPYLISALWAGNSGSLLFWGWIVSLAAAVVILRKRKQGQELVPYAAIIIMLVQAFFLLLILFAQNPFHKLDFIPTEGVGLSPVLENPGMIFHPPMLLAGFALFTVPFAFAIAALITRRLNNDWLVAVRRWTLLAWLMLGVGNLIGAWWAYAELGWGGYWAWDPVENAGLMPWLVATAFLHSIMIQRRKGVFRLWSMALIMLTFILTIFGTFITRSNILGSVHTFGQTAVGPFFLVLLIIIFVGSLALLIYRRKDLKSEAESGPLISSGNTFLLNNILLVGATLIIFIGTIFPSLTEAIGGARATINTSFFNLSATPIFLAVILLAGVCILVTWRRPAIEKLRSYLLWPAVAALVVVAAMLIFGVRQWPALVVYFISTFIISAVFSQWYREVSAHRKAKATDYFSSFWKLLVANRSRYGGFLVHIALAIVAIGVMGSSTFDVERDEGLAPGGQTEINGYTITYEGMESSPVRNRMRFTAVFSIYKGDNFISSLRPHADAYIVFNEEGEEETLINTEAAIRSTLTEDLYIVLNMYLDDDMTFRYFFTFKVIPLVVWIWIGGGVFILGGLVAFWPGKKD